MTQTNTLLLFTFTLFLLNACVDEAKKPNDVVCIICNDTTAPENPSVSIDNGSGSTIYANVTLNLSASDDVGITGYYASENSATPSATDSSWVAVSSTRSYSDDVSFTLSTGTDNKTVNVWFKDATGNISSAANDKISCTLSCLPLFVAADSDGMVLLSGRTFTMGDIQGGGGTDESPTHSVTLSSFYISEDEVTAAEYAACVSAGSCTAQSSGTYSTLGDTTGKAVNYVSWNDFTS